MIAKPGVFLMNSNNKRDKSLFPKKNLIKNKKNKKCIIVIF